MPFGPGGELQQTRHIRQLLDLRCHDRILRCVLLAVRSSAVEGCVEDRGASARDLVTYDLPFSDEPGGELGGAASLAGRAAQDQGVSAILDDRLRFGVSVRAADLSDALESKDASAT